MRSKWADRLLLVSVAALIFGALVAFGLVRSRPPEWVQQLVDANPAWHIGRAPNGWLEATERSSGARLLIAESEAGAYAMSRVPCAEMLEVAPPWFRIPPDESATPARPCVRLTAPGHEVWISNFRTTLDVPEIWTDYYEPLTRDYKYGGSGASSTTLPRRSAQPAPSAASGGGMGDPAPAGDTRRLANVVGYSVSAHDPADRRETRLAAFYVDGRATVVVAFRDVAP